MKIENIPITQEYYNNVNANSNQTAFRSLLYNPKSFIHRINPIVRYMDDYFQRSVNVSRMAWHIKDHELAPFITEIKTQKKHNLPSVTLWDINKDDRKKYLVIYHGLSHNISSLQTLYKEILNNTDFAILAAEYRNYEKGNKEFTYHSPKRLAQDTESAFQYLKEKGIPEENIAVLGHSFGGYAATKMAKKHKNLISLILASSTNTYKHRINAIVYGNKRNIPQGIKDLLVKSKLLRYPLGIIFNTGKVLKKTSVPVDIIHSKADKLITLDMAKDLASSAKDLNSFSIVEGSHKMDENKIKKIVELLKLK